MSVKIDHNPVMKTSKSQSEYDHFFPAEAQDVDEYLEQFKPNYYKLCLYINPKNPRSIKAVQQIQQICEQYLSERYSLEIVDIHEHPERLQEDQVFAVPTLIKRLPPPLYKLIGDMSDIAKVTVALGLQGEC